MTNRIMVVTVLEKSPWFNVGGVHCYQQAR